MKANDEEAFRDFVNARWHSLLRTAYLLVGDYGYAEDLVQVALVRTHRRWLKIERIDAPDAYLRKVLVNLASSHWRRRLRFRESLVAEPPDGTEDDAAAVSDQRDEVWAALRSLPPRMRAVLVLRYFEDLSEVETAAILGCSTGTVKSQASRGLDRLRGVLLGAQVDAGSVKGEMSA
ncbi:SigE family RNA polymerase sigma factor [Actinopolymorpha alba]|uniref:SigE family RNA polymerase sigma factor n=1 Tax=Actinopolymorpha alba TaxID=533267 RepID=UPI00035D03CD|nr:SigE family RNA polymerase sigma factor [Actinopolymorpha alba]